MSRSQEIDDILKLKDVILAKKQGEALERITRPSKHLEGLGLGHYGAETVLALNAIDLIEDTINALATSENPDIEELPIFTATKNLLHDFTRGIGVASGSISAKRMEKSLETIGTLGQFTPTARAEGSGDEVEISED